MAVENLDLDKGTFEVGKSYKKEVIDEMIKRNKNVSIVNAYGSTFPPRKNAIHINLTLENIDLWFIRDSYHSFRCVMFEN